MALKEVSRTTGNDPATNSTIETNAQNRIVPYPKTAGLYQAERVMIAKTPEHAVDLLDQAFHQGDLEGVLRYYDDAAVVIPIPGTQARLT